MEIIKNPLDMQELALSLLKSGIRVGVVPTMGALHQGHLSLIKGSLSENDKTIVTIFVNPTQFGPSEDLSQYPQPIQDDIASLEQLNVDYLFHPDVQDMYPTDYSSYVEVENITNKLCGLSRPVHFKGVTTICSKLFHLTLPRTAYFGQKDYQQTLVLKKMIRDLHFPMTIKVLPIVREQDGLAMSSRNQYLSPDNRQKALNLNKSLKKADEMIQNGITNCQTISDEIKKMINPSETVKIDYISICHPQTLEESDRLPINKVLIALAVFVGKTRLIDNALIKVP